VQSRLAVESQNILRLMVEDLRTSSSIRANNSIEDENAPGAGWTTSNDNLILIVSTPAVDDSNNYIVNEDTNRIYHNEFVYYASGSTLYKRSLANPDAEDNKLSTSCPKAIATSSCPPDAVISD